MTSSTIDWRRLVRRLLFLTTEAAIILYVFLSVLLVGIVPSASMEPAIREGSLIIGTRARFAGPIERGDIVIFPGEDGALLVKRVVGLPGESVSIDAQGGVRIDGAPLIEPYVARQHSGYTGAFTVPANALLALGDNRAESIDSRYWPEPYIQLEAVIAKQGLHLSFP